MAILGSPPILSLIKVPNPQLNLNLSALYKVPNSTLPVLYATLLEHEY